MAALHPNLRKKLEKAVVKARDIAEKAAKSALQSLAVDSHQPFDHMSPDLRQLRVKLRARGRTVGDRIDAKGKQGLWHLIREAAYEHWHRMLFARFLAENNLLMHPDGVAVTLDECEELAAEEGLDKWELASRYAAKMLPAIFRPDDPVLQIEFAPEDKLELERLLTDLELEVFDADDSLGWVYQFWQVKRKKEVNDSEKKIGADELPAVTQLFTEDYMVKFLLHNSLGAWWAGKFLAANPKIAQDKQLTEDDLRKAIAFDDYNFDYLRFIFDEGNKTWKPAAGCFKGWPKEAKNITVLDPCCGSGHFLVAVFELIVRIRMAEEDLSVKDAVDGVINDNLFGLEIDARCTQIAAFVLAFTAWKFPDAEGFRELPQLNIACCGIPVTAKKEDWLKLANGDQNFRLALDFLYDEFRNAPVLGSLLNPQKSDAAKLVGWQSLADAVGGALEKDRPEEEYQTGVAAQGLAKAAQLLGDKYSWVITNVPYLSRGKQCSELKEFSEHNYGKARNDLATVFLDRCLEFCVKGGNCSIVMPQNWLFLTSYKKFREKLLKNDTWHLIARLGPAAFETISGEVVKAILISLDRGNASGQQGGLFSETEACHLIRGLDVSEPRTAAEKAEQLLTVEVKSVEQAKQLDNPDARILDSKANALAPLNNYCFPFPGINCGDSLRFIVKFWEVSSNEKRWSKQQTSGIGNKIFDGLDSLFLWENGNGEFFNFVQSLEGRLGGSWHRGQEAWGEKGIAVSRMRDLHSNRYLGSIFDQSVAVLIPNNIDEFTAIECYIFSEEYWNAVRTLNPSLAVSTSVLTEVPFDLKHWTKIAEEKYPNGLPKPYSDDPTQWIFHGHPCGSVVWDDKSKTVVQGPLRSDETVPQVALARLLCYCWPAELDSAMELSDEAFAWVQKSESLLSLADEDGIVCIPAVRGEQPAADRLRSVLAAAFENEWSPAKETELLSAVDGRRGLEDWLRNKFFVQHCKLFHNRPFIWHIWDGQRDGFAALVNYHKLDRKLLETLTYAYLGDWINKQKADFEAGVGPAETKMLAAQILQKKLELILRGEKPYDIFVRWKPIHEQSIGWEPDLNDGVRMNVRPFFEADILRKKTNIKWKKDRGKEPARKNDQYPWFWNDREFAGERVNDIHLSLKEKQEAREKAAKEGAAK